jgi:hypothetical protein
MDSQNRNARKDLAPLSDCLDGRSATAMRFLLTSFVDARPAKSILLPSHLASRRFKLKP